MLKNLKLLMFHHVINRERFMGKVCRTHILRLSPDAICFCELCHDRSTESLTQTSLDIHPYHQLFDCVLVSFLCVSVRQKIFCCCSHLIPISLSPHLFLSRTLQPSLNKQTTKLILRVYKKYIKCEKSWEYKSLPRIEAWTLKENYWKL